MLHVRRWVAGLATAAVTLPLLVSCSSDSGPSLVVYNAQHEELLDEVVQGVHRRRPASRSSCATATTSSWPTSWSQEGTASPADVFLTENSPAMSLVDSKGLFAPARRRRRWTRSRRSTAPTTATGSASPPARRCWSTTPTRSARTSCRTSIMELAEPQWKGRIVLLADRRGLPGDRQRGPRDSRASRPPRTWLDGPADNGTVYDGNDVVLQSVNSGEVDAGVIYHYYWYRDQEESGENSDSSSCTSSATRTRARSSASPVPACSKSSDDAGRRPAVRRLPDQRGGPAGHRRQLRAGVPAQPAGAPGPRGQAVRRAASPPRSTSRALNGPKVVELMQDAGFL